MSKATEYQDMISREVKKSFDREILVEQLEEAKANYRQAKEDKKRAKRDLSEAEDDMEYYQSEINGYKEELEEFDRRCG